MVGKKGREGWKEGREGGRKKGRKKNASFLPSSIVPGTINHNQIALLLSIHPPCVPFFRLSFLPSFLQ
jgi:hypothetical protein